MTTRIQPPPDRPWRRRAIALAGAVLPAIVLTYQLTPVTGVVLRSAGATAGSAAGATSGSAGSAGSAGGATAGSAGDEFATTRIVLDSGRAYLLHAPVTPGEPRPLVVALHGAAHSPTFMETQTGLTTFADEHGFTLAYGSGTGGRWNAGTCCGSARDNNVDDVGYLRQLVADAGARTPVDPDRVYVLGFSNGGMMALRAGCEAPDVFAAAGTVAGTLLVDCPTGVDAIHLHAPADTTVPYLGGVGYEGVLFPPAWDEPLRMPAGALHVSVAVSGGHGWPASANGYLWDFLSAQHR